MIEIKDVSFRYGSGERDVGLSAIDLVIPDGQVVLLCGESGCGKTTLTRLINGLIPHFYEGALAGQVLVNGLDMLKTPLHEISSMVGSVFQNPRAQFFNVDTTSEIAFGCENMGIHQEEIHRRIRIAKNEQQLAPLMNRSIFALSGGEKQKVACASVSVLQPDIFVLDEPSSNLDAVATAELAKMIGMWKSAGKTIVISEHRLHYLADLADRVIYMQNGRIQRDMTMKEFTALPQKQTQSMGLRPLRLESLVAKRAAVELTAPDALRLTNLHFGYKHCRETLSIPELLLPMGSVVAVIGHNGAGKSTLGRCICGLEKKCRGEMHCAHHLLSCKERLKHCYMVMQDVNHQLFTESVLDEVLLSMEAEDTAAAETILDSLGLLAFKDLHPMSLSGGQKQRVAIASAIASGREIILFDEPTSGLDLHHMAEVAENIMALQRQGKTIFVITHDPELILRCSTHVLEMAQGAVVTEYPLDEAGAKRVLGFFVDAAFCVQGEAVCF